jgi:site-specific recombinase XerD
VTAERTPARLPADPLDLAVELPLTADEAAYVRAARAPNTLRGYRSDWSDFTAWCAQARLDPLPAAAATISSYLTELARAGAKVGTLSRRLSAIRFAHQLRDLADPTTAARVVAVWEGIRRTHGAPPEQVTPLMPPGLLEVLVACPTTKSWKTRGRAEEPDLAGLRDRALLLVGFWAALRRSELAGLTVDQITDHPNGLVLALPRSKTNLYGLEAELVVLPRAGHRGRCPVTALQTWLDAAVLTEGPVLRPVSKGNRALSRSLHPESINDLVQAAVARAGLDPTSYSAHSLRAGFVTYAHLRGASDRAIARTRPVTGLGRPWAPTSGFTRPGPTTRPPNWASSCTELPTCRRHARTGSQALRMATRTSPPSEPDRWVIQQLAEEVLEYRRAAVTPRELGAAEPVDLVTGKTQPRRSSSSARCSCSCACSRSQATCPTGSAGAK